MSHIFKAVGKVVGKVLKSPVGKIALAAAAVYTGGAALGVFGGAEAAGGAAAAGALDAGDSAFLSAAGATGTSAAAATAAGAGGFFSTLSSVGKVASAVQSIGGLLSSSSTDYSPALTQQGGTAAAPASDPTAQAAADAAAQDEINRKRRGSAANILTSPLGLSDSGQSASQLLLG